MTFKDKFQKKLNNLIVQINENDIDQSNEIIEALELKESSFKDRHQPKFFINSKYYLKPKQEK